MEDRTMRRLYPGTLMGQVEASKAQAQEAAAASQAAELAYQAVAGTSEGNAAARKAHAAAKKSCEEAERAAVIAATAQVTLPMATVMSAVCGLAVDEAVGEGHIALPQVREVSHCKECTLLPAGP